MRPKNLTGTTKVKGELEIDHNRGVIYFHTGDPKIATEFGSVTILRICGLGVIPRRAMDITHGKAIGYSAP